MKKHAYLILAHNEFHMLKKLIHELDDERNDIYIHIDKKTKYVDENEISSWVIKSGVFFVPRIKIYWGTLSIVKAEIALLAAAAYRKYHYYHLLSGVDFPIKNQDAIHNFFEDKDNEFISFHQDGTYEDYFLKKIKFYYPLLKYVGKGNFDGPGRKRAFMRWLVEQQWKLEKFQEEHGVDRISKYNDVTFFKGDQWFSITHDFAVYIVAQKRKIFKMFRFTNGPDEFVMPTFANNSDFSDRVINTSLRKIDWNRGAPYEFTEDDLDELWQSEGFFARKISYDNHPALVSRLISNLHPKEFIDNNPLVSIIVPCYNVEAYLAKCVDSLIAQTYKNIEILLIDDGATDRTSELAQEYASKYDKVFYYRRENGGLSAARNTGIELCNGSLIAFVDSDDWVSETYIEALYNALGMTGADVSVCGYIKEELEHGSVFFDENRVVSAHEAMKILGDIYPKENVLMVVAWNKLYKRKVFEDIRFPVGKIHEDEHTVHRYISKTESVALITDCLYHYRIRLDGITGVQRNQSFKHLDLLDALEERIEYSRNMMYGDILIYMLYTYFEGMKQLMIKYGNEVFEKGRLSKIFRGRALNVYLRYFSCLDGFQKRDYMKLILFVKKYRNTVISNLNSKED